MTLGMAEYGSIVRIKHHLTGQTLHSHAHNYAHEGSSYQQQVTAFGGVDDNDLWCIKAIHGELYDVQTVKDGDLFRLEHLLTGRNLHSHEGFPSPVIRTQQEVTCFGDNGMGDGNDNWRIEVEGSGYWSVGKRVRLIHVRTNHALHSHQGFVHPQWTMGQQEVTGFAGRDDNDWWSLAEVVHARGEVSYGSVIKLKHQLTNHTLHSHAHHYGHEGSSRQQQVTAFGGADDNDLWRIKRKHGGPYDFRPVRHGDLIRLEHLFTGRNLHSHVGFPSPVIRTQQEVTCFGENGTGDDNDNWRIEIEGGGLWAVGKRIRLIHVLTDYALHSHQGFAHPQWTMGQQEVTCFANRDDNDWWYLAQVNYSPDIIVQKLQVEICMGDQGTDTAWPFRSDPSNVVGFVRLGSGKEFLKDFSGDTSWPPFSRHVGEILLPSARRLGELKVFGIRSITAGPDFAADNWNLSELKVTFVGPNASGALLYRAGNPIWYFQRDRNDVWEAPIQQ